MKKLDFRWVLTLIYCGFIAALLVIHGKENAVWSQTAYLIAPLTSIIAGLLTLGHLGWEGKRAAVFKSILIALGLWFLGEFTTLYLIWKDITPYPSLADVFFLLGYAVFSVGVILESRLFEVHWKKLNSLLVTALTTLFILVVGIVIYIAVKGYKPEESLVVNLTTISWSVGDLVMGGLTLVLLAMMWEYREGTVKRGWLWFMSATVINLVADTIYNLYPEAVADGSWLNFFLNSLWGGAYILFAGYFLEMRRELDRLQSKIK